MNQTHEHTACQNPEPSRLDRYFSYIRQLRENYERLRRNNVVIQTAESMYRYGDIEEREDVWKLIITELVKQNEALTQWVTKQSWEAPSVIS